MFYYKFYFFIFCFFCFLKKRKKTIVVNFLIIFYTQLGLKKLNHTSNFYNVISIMNTSDNIIIFLVIIFLVIIFLKNFPQQYLYKYIYFCLFLVFFVKSNLFCNNLHINEFFFFFKKCFIINTKLLNGIMLIHPIFLYISYSIILVVCVYFYLMRLNRCLYFFNYLIFIKKISYLVFFLLYFSVFLGCIWAEHELS